MGRRKEEEEEEEVDNDDDNEEESDDLIRANPHWSRQVLIGMNLLVAFIGLAGLGLTLYVLLGGSAQVELELVPTWSFYILIGLSFFACFLGFLAVFAIKRRKRFLLSLFLFLVSFIFFMKLIVCCVLIFSYLNISDGIAQEGEVSLLVSEIEEQVAIYAFKNPADWIKIQDKLVCCGFDFRQAFLLSVPVDVIASNAGNLNREDVRSLYGGAVPSHVDALHSGHACTAQGASETDFFILNSPNGVYDIQAETLYLANATVTSVQSGYYCREKVLSSAKPYYVGVAVVAAFILFIEAISIVLCFMLLCSVPDHRGGFKKTNRDGKSSATTRAAGEDEEENNNQ